MKASEALRLLESEHPHDRLRGARALLEKATAEEQPHLERALARETVSWVRQALQRTLDRLNERAPRANTSDATEDIVTDAVISDIYLKAMEEVLSTLLHEVQPRIGYVRNAASREIDRFEESDTKSEIENLEKLLALLAELRRVSQTPSSVSFDLADLLSQVVAELGDENVQLAGPRPLIVFGEPARVRLAFANGLRNAIEATLALEDGSERKVVVNWGVDEEQYWISVVDEGPGVRGSLDGMFAIGRTTKHDHFGMGLPLARQAMLALGGQVTLAPSAQGGARFEIRWERLSADAQAEAT